MSLKYLAIFICLAISFTGCSTVKKRQTKQTSILSAAINDSIKVGRFDRAKEFSDQLVKLTPPVKTKDKIKVNKFQTVRVNIDKKGIFTKEELIPDKKFIVLPEGSKVENVIVKNDEQFKLILNENPKLQKEELKIDEELKKSEEKVNQILIDKENELEKSRGQNKGFFSSIFGFFKGLFGLGLIGTIIIIIATAFLAPEFLPVIFTAIKWFFKWCINLFGGLISGIMSFFKK